MADKTALSTQVYDLLTTTNNASATEKQRLRDRAVLLYPSHWQRFLTETGLTDTAANRGRFVGWLTVNKFWADIYRLGSDRANRDALPAPENL